MTDDTTPDVPAWLDLDSIVPPATRSELAELADAFERVGIEVADLAGRTFDLLNRYEDSFDAAGVPDEMMAPVSKMTGHAALLAQMGWIDFLINTGSHGCALDNEQMIREQFDLPAFLRPA